MVTTQGFVEGYGRLHHAKLSDINAQVLPTFHFISTLKKYNEKLPMALAGSGQIRKQRWTRNMAVPTELGVTRQFHIWLQTPPYDSTYDYSADCRGVYIGKQSRHPIFTYQIGPPVVERKNTPNPPPAKTRHNEEGRKARPQSLENVSIGMTLFQTDRVMVQSRNPENPTSCPQNTLSVCHARIRSHIVVIPEIPWKLSFPSNHFRTTQLSL